MNGWIDGYDLIDWMMDGAYMTDENGEHPIHTTVERIERHVEEMDKRKDVDLIIEGISNQNSEPHITLNLSQIDYLKDLASDCHTNDDHMKILAMSEFVGAIEWILYNEVVGK